MGLTRVPTTSLAFKQAGIENSLAPVGEVSRSFKGLNKCIQWLAPLIRTNILDGLNYLSANLSTN